MGSPVQASLNSFRSGSPPLRGLQITTVHVDGPYKFIVTSDLPSYNFENIRFEIKGGAEFHFVIEAQLSLNYAESQASYSSSFRSTLKVLATIGLRG